MAGVFRIEKIKEDNITLVKVFYKDVVLYVDVLPDELFESDLADHIAAWEEFVKNADGAIQVLRDDVMLVYFLKGISEDQHKKLYRYFTGVVDNGFIVYNKVDKKFYFADHEGNILSEEPLKVIHIYK